MSIKESDWKVFCEIKDAAIQRYCTKQLNDVIDSMSDESELPSERFHFLCEHVKTSQKTMRQIFDGHSRNNAFIQLMLMCEEELVTAEEFERFSDELRDDVTKLLRRRS